MILWTRILQELKNCIITFLAAQNTFSARLVPITRRLRGLNLSKLIVWVFDELLKLESHRPPTTIPIIVAMARLGSRLIP